MRIDLRIRSDEVAVAHGLQPLTPAARRWVERHAVPRGGLWRETDGVACFWMLDDAFPREQLRDSGLVVTIGPGETMTYDVPADRWLGRAHPRHA